MLPFRLGFFFWGLMATLAIKRPVIAVTLQDYSGVASNGRLRKEQKSLESPNLPALESAQLDKGEEAAAKGSEAMEHNDPDKAAHQFSRAANDLEAAHNDAIAQGSTDSDALSRGEKEHELAERVEGLAQKNREQSAVAASQSSVPTKQLELDSKPKDDEDEASDKALEKKEEQEVEEKVDKEEITPATKGVESSEESEKNVSEESEKVNEVEKDVADESGEGDDMTTLVQPATDAAAQPEEALDAGENKLSDAAANTEDN